MIDCLFFEASSTNEVHPLHFTALCSERPNMKARFTETVDFPTFAPPQQGICFVTKQVCQAHPNLQLSAATPPFPLAHSSTNLTVLCTSAPPRGLRNWSDRSCNFIGDVTLQAFGNKGFVGSCRTNETRWFSSMLHFTCRCITKGISQNPFTLMFEEASTLKLNCLNPSCTCVGGLVNVLPAVAPTFSKDAPSSTAHVGVFILSLHVFRSQNHFFQVSQYLWICEPWLLWSGLNSAYYASELNQNFILWSLSWLQSSDLSVDSGLFRKWDLVFCCHAQELRSLGRLVTSTCFRCGLEAAEPDYKFKIWNEHIVQ